MTLSAFQFLVLLLLCYCFLLDMFIQHCFLLNTGSVKVCQRTAGLCLFTQKLATLQQKKLVVTKFVQDILPVSSSESYKFDILMSTFCHSLQAYVLKAKSIHGMLLDKNKDFRIVVIHESFGQLKSITRRLKVCLLVIISLV